MGLVSRLPAALVDIKSLVGASIRLQRNTEVQLKEAYSYRYSYQGRRHKLISGPRPEYRCYVGDKHLAGSTAVLRATNNIAPTYYHY